MRVYSGDAVSLLVTLVFAAVFTYVVIGLRIVWVRRQILKLLARGATHSSYELQTRFGGAVYIALSNLEDGGLITWEMRDGYGTNGPRRYYEITQHGLDSMRGVVR